MANPARRAANDAATRRASGGRDSGAVDVTSPTYLTRATLGPRTARILSGRGVFYPGYRLVGEGKSAPSEDNMTVNIVKMVSPLTGQSPVNNGRYYGRNFDILPVRILRQQRAVASTQFGTAKVVRPKYTAIRRMTGSGQGVVGYV